MKIDGHGSNKLNAACVFGGPDLTMSTINDHFGTNISQYVMVNISGLADIIDLLGGVELDVTKEERDALNKGLFDLSEYSGMEKLEEYGEGVASERQSGGRIRAHPQDRQRFRRTERQRELLTVIAEKLSENDSLTILAVINKLLPYVQTNISLVDLISLASIGLQMDMNAIEQFRIPADGTFEAGMFGSVWCVKPNFKKNAQLLYDFVYNDDSTIPGTQSGEQVKRKGRPKRIRAPF